MGNDCPMGDKMGEKKMEAEIFFKGIVFLDLFFFLRDLTSGT